MKVYLASPLGFSELGRIAMVHIVARLEELGHEVLNPWDQDFSEDIAMAMADGSETAVRALELKISRANVVLIDEADALLGVLEGEDIGTTHEMGWAAKDGKPVYALWTDFRSRGDFGPKGLPFNLQVGEGLVAVFRSIADINF